jgi:hypothetical protein
MKNDNQIILEIRGKIPKGCFTLHGGIFPMSQFEEVLTAWFRGEALPTPKQP